MRIIYTVVLSLLLMGCVKATYSNKDGVEKFELWSILKSIEGLSAMKTPDIFAIKISKTANTNVVEDIAAILKFYENPLQQQGKP